MAEDNWINDIKNAILHLFGQDTDAD